MSFDIDKIRSDFPILNQKIYGKPLVYFDNAATTQKPQRVIDKITEIYTQYNSNIHRGAHFLSNKTTSEAEKARNTVSKFINARSTDEIIFTSGATQSINLLAQSFGKAFIKEGDEIIVSEMEHHSNLVPWKMLSQQQNAKVIKWTFDENGELDIEELKKIINKNTRLIAVNQVSNVLGTINPIKEIVTLAHKYNIKVLIDGAQAIQHLNVDVQELDCDFYVFSGHKTYAPNGIGVLYGKEYLLEQMPPYQGGGEMVESVSFDKITYNSLPFKFEAGTPNYVGMIGLGEALNYLKNIGLEHIADYEKKLLEYAEKKLKTISNLKIYGTSKNKASVISFLVKDIHTLDMGMILDKNGIALRTGKHCCEPIMRKFGIQGTIRASFAFYNTFEEIDYFYENITKTIKFLT